MMRSLFSGVSGLKGHQTRMDVIGNNIANVNTTGFKSSRANFADTLSQTLSSASSPTGTLGGTNPKQIGLGSSISSIDTIFTDGSVQSTGKNTDLCLSGNGLFVVKNGDQTYYTRNGAFEFDANGNYIQSGSGLFVQGWTDKASDGTINTSGKPGKITIPSGKSMPASATSSITYENNLNANTTGYEISNILVKYKDGTSKTTTAYVPNLPSTTIETDSGMKFVLDGDSSGIFTTNESLYGKDLFQQTISKVTGSADVTLDTEDASGNKVEGLGTINYTSGDHSIPSDVTLEGTIDEVSVNAATGKTQLTLTLSQPTEKNGTKVTITLANPNGTYAEGNTASFNFPVSEIVPQTGSSITNSDGKTYQYESAAVDPAITKENYNKYTYKGHPADGKVDKVTVNSGDNVESVTINTTDGNTVTGLVENKYSQGDVVYPSYVTLTTVYDSLGGEHSIPLLYTKTANNTWSLSLGTGGSSTSVTDAEGRTINYNLTATDLVFDENGKYVSGDATLKVSYDYGTVKDANGNTINPPSDQAIIINVAALTQYSGGTTINGTSNGNAAGTLQSVAIDSTGTITGTYTNGLKQAEGQVAIAQFNNAAGLTKTGNSLYQESNNSGTANVKAANDLGVTITGSALEMSNVDISDEFSNMIITQRGFQSNSKIITVSDEMLETLINMKR